MTRKSTVSGIGYHESHHIESSKPFGITCNDPFWKWDLEKWWRKRELYYKTKPFPDFGVVVCHNLVDYNRREFDRFDSHFDNGHNEERYYYWRKIPTIYLYTYFWCWDSIRSTKEELDKNKFHRSIWQSNNFQKNFNEMDVDRKFKWMLSHCHFHTL